MSIHSDDNDPNWEDGDVSTDSVVEAGRDLVYGILQNELSFDAIKAKVLNDKAPVWFQIEDGTSALHAAAYNEDVELVRFLIAEGAVWNAVDELHNTAADIALSLNNEECYTLIRDAGIRSELLLTLLSSKNALAGSSLSLVLKATDETAAGDTDNFLASRLRYTRDEHGQEICLVSVSDSEDVGVMMGWERDIMKETVNLLCTNHPNLQEGLKILNVGFGLGIIDSYFQALPTRPSQHVIIEAHPDVLQHMRELGWYEKPGVQILEGKWQDFMESEELLGVGCFDVVYTDTFSEDYKALHQFFGHLPDLLAGPESRFSFFHGLGATNNTFYDVYTHVSDLHLADIGINVDWSDVDVVEGKQDRWNETRKYFSVRTYRLPIGKMRGM
ncbi:S-adenosyl-L-methionine-dependent methyltransferase [Cristinia sonorae]|uniref:S-adenosyl-L-methionine-dependent methyltransferase n=1 Tax=Cristinia sonorae TaxID=1940300 RepID=A0A8K0UF09_9AGAR|nr:S-adenosyl-L-methionine-dependent methyltransferase [Cristinia sonorae]